jgi:ParB family chromosome partitioning protein
MFSLYSRYILQRITKLSPHPRNNEFFDDIIGDNWIEFKKSIETSGVIEPIVITQDYTIVSGHQRVRACKELNITEVPCEVKIYDSEQQIIKDLLETNLRQRGIGNTNAIKLGRCIVELEKIYGIYKGNHQKENLNNSVSQNELAEQLKMSQDQLGNYKKLLTLIPELQSLIETNQLSPTVGYKVLSKLSQQDQQKLIAEFGKDYISQLTQKKAEELIQNRENATINNLRAEVLSRQENINNQLGRRNVTEIQKSYLRGLQYEREKKKSEDNLKRGQDSPIRQNDASGTTAKKLAEQHQVSPRTIERDAKFSNALNDLSDIAGEDIKGKILNQEIKLTKERMD